MCIFKVENVAVTLNLPLMLSHVSKEIDAEVACTVSGSPIYMPCLHALHLILLLQLGILNKLQLPLLGARAEVC